MTITDYADQLGVCPATVSNYKRALRNEGKRVTLTTLRVHHRRLAPGPAPDRNRAKAIVRMRERQHMTWAAIGDVWGVSGSRAWAIYRGAQ